MSISYHVYLYFGYKLDMKMFSEDARFLIDEIFNGIEEDDNRNANGKNTQFIHDQMSGRYVLVGKQLCDMQPIYDCGELVSVEPQNINDEWKAAAKEEILSAYPEIKDILEKQEISLFMISHAW